MKFCKNFPKLNFHEFFQIFGGKNFIALLKGSEQEHVRHGNIRKYTISMTDDGKLFTQEMQTTIKL